MTTDNRPDVVLMDVSLSGTDSATATRAIRQASPLTRVIGMSSFQDEGLAPEMLRAGATGYLLKNVSAEELARAVRQAYAAGGAPVPASEERGGMHQIKSRSMPAMPTKHGHV